MEATASGVSFTFSTWTRPNSTRHATSPRIIRGRPPGSRFQAACRETRAPATVPRSAGSRTCIHTSNRVFLFSLTRRAQDPLRVRRPGRSPPRRRRGRGSVSPPRTRAIRHRSEGRSSSPRRLGNLRWSPAGRTQNQDHEGYPSRGEHTQGTRAHLALRRRAAVRYRRARWTAREERRKRSRRGREER